MSGDDEWLTLNVPDPLPRIEPGIYEGKSVAVEKYRVFERTCLRIMFNVFKGPAVNGEVIAQLPGYFRIPESRRLSPSSKLFRVLQLLDPATRRDRIPLRILKDKLWSLEVGDVTVTSEKDIFRRQRLLHKRQVHSVVCAVLERLA